MRTCSLMQPISHEIWDSKYRLKDANGYPIDQTLDDTLERVAGALANVEERPDDWYEPFLWALKNGAVPAGRIMSNAGAQDHKPGTSLINCVVSDTLPDSMEGILAKLAEAGLSLKAGCGIGYEFSTLRPKGAKVMGPGAYTSGPLPFMDVFDALCTTVSSAGGRRGAQMATFDASHPDVLDFIRAKRQDGRLRQFNLSLLVSDRLMDAVKAGAEWPLVFPGREEVYPSIQASALWDEIMRSTYEYAEPGVLFIDRINQYNNLWWCEDIRATNPCVVGSTRLHTSRGLVRMDELYHSGESLRVIADRRGLGLEGTGVEVRDAVPVFMSSPSAEIYRVQTKAGYSLRATAWHRLPTDRGSVEVKDLREGDTLLIQSGEGLFGGQGSEQLGLLLGLIAGDGYFTDHEGCQEATVQLWGAKRVVAEGVETFVNAILSGLSERGRTYQARFCPVAKRDVISLGSILLARYLEQFGFTADTKLRVPEVVWQGTRECVVGYLRGLFLSDGSVQGGGHGRCSIRLSSSEPNLLYDVQVLLANFGIFCGVYHRRRAGERLLPDGRGGLKSYWCRDNYELIVDGESRELFGEKIGFLHPEHLRKFSTRSLNASTSRPRRFATKVTSVTFDGVEPVYDTTQPDHNLVTFNGLVSHQCGEQPLSSYGACLLGSVDLTKFVRNPLSPGVQFDWSAYRKVVSIFTRMLDNVVEIANLPLPEQREELRRKRRHGMGVLGLGSAMAMLGIRYGSSDSCSFTGTVMRVMAEVGWEEAVQLAVGKGPAPIMGELFEIDGGVLGERRGLRDFLGGRICGSTLFARGSLYMHKLGEVYPTIVEDLAYHGARFTHHTSIAPTGTITLAFANNASNGIEPSFAHQYTRNLTKQNRKTREAVEVYSAEALLWRETYGDEPYPDYFVTAEQVSPKEHINVQAAAQRWVDSSISKTINCPTGMSFEEFKEVYQYAYEKGLKGCATFRFNPEFQQGILVTTENLANTQYRFRLDDGMLIEVRGDDVIEYEGESHSVANLYDALKEGRYGRY